MTASLLQQLLALYFAIIYSWQLSGSEKSLAGIKFLLYTSRIYTDLDFFYTDICAYFLLRKAYAVL